MLRPSDRPSDLMCVVVSGRDALLRAWDCLEGQAKERQIPRVSAVRLYYEVRVSGRLARDLLHHLGPAANDADRAAREKLGTIVNTTSISVKFSAGAQFLAGRML